jgi:hypothetical protein
VVLNRVGGIVGVLVGSYANVETTAPLFVCASLFGLLSQRVEGANRLWYGHEGQVQPSLEQPEQLSELLTLRF